MPGNRGADHARQHDRYDNFVAVGDLKQEEDRRHRCVGRCREESSHTDQGISSRGNRSIGENSTGDVAESTTGDCAEVETGSEKPAGQAGSECNGCCNRLDQHQRSEEIPGLVAEQNRLHELIAVTEDLGEDNTDHANEESAEQRLGQLRHFQGGKVILDAKMGVDKKGCQNTDQQTEQQVEQQLPVAVDQVNGGIKFRDIAKQST